MFMGDLASRNPVLCGRKNNRRLHREMHFEIGFIDDCSRRGGLVLVCGGRQISENDVRKFYEQEAAWTAEGDAKKLCDAMDEKYSAEITAAALYAALASGRITLAPQTNPKGFHWMDRAGDWIDYNTQGQVVSWGDKNTTTTWLA